MTAPTFNPGSCEGLSAFQCDHIRSLEKDTTFYCFVLVDGDPIKTFSRTTPGPKNVLWYDKQGNLWLDRVGRTKLLRRISTKEETNQ